MWNGMSQFRIRTSGSISGKVWHHGVSFLLEGLKTEVILHRYIMNNFTGMIICMKHINAKFVAYLLENVFFFV
jgi:hypothetical protein